MLKTIENRILNFANELAIKRAEMVHGTLYLTLENDRDCDNVHAMIRTFYRTKIQPDGGVNMYAVGDEFAFDFVPEDREAPVFTDEEEKGVWSEFAEEEILNNMPDEVDTEMQLEIEQMKGK